MLDTLVHLSSAVDFDTVVKIAKGIVGLISQSDSNSEGLSSVVEGLSSQGSVESTTETTAAAEEATTTTATAANA